MPAANQTGRYSQAGTGFENGYRAVPVHSRRRSRQPSCTVAVEHRTYDAGRVSRQSSTEYLIPPETFASEFEVKRFVDVAPSLNIARSGLAGGALMDDFDGDGYRDIIVS